MEQSNLDNILDGFTFDSDAGDNLTLRGYLEVLLTRLWIEAEGFSGKRPFGNSSWQLDVYTELIRHGHIKGKLDEEGCIDTINAADTIYSASVLVQTLIEHIFKEPQ